MDNLLTKKRKLEEYDAVLNNPKLKISQYDENYLSFGFSFHMRGLS